MDYYGGKAVMGWGVALWSFATFLTPWAAEKSLWALLAMRAMLGIAEGVALPSMNNMISKYGYHVYFPNLFTEHSDSATNFMFSFLFFPCLWLSALNNAFLSSFLNVSV